MLGAIGLNKRVNGEVYLDDISFTMKPGCFYSLIGRTQSGKTTLLKALAGLESLDEGQITMNGKNITAEPVWKRRVSMVYQQFINYPHLNVFDNVAFPLRKQKLSKSEILDRVLGVLKLVELTDLKDRRVSKLSGGQQQRTAIARALVKDSELILLDEPLVNLDYKLREQMRDQFDLILRHNRKAIVIYATTDPDEALLLGGETLVLHEGKLIQKGPALDVHLNPKSRDVATIFYDPPMNIIRGKIIAGTIEVGQEFRIPRPEHFRDLADGEYDFGIPAQHIHINAEDSKMAAGIIKLIEVSGSESFIHIDINGLKLVVQEQGYLATKTGEITAVGLDQDFLYSFDPADGKLVAGPSYI